MIKLDKLFTSGSWTGKMSTYLAATATVGMLTLGAAAWHNRAHAERSDLEEFENLALKAELYDINQIEVRFHKAGSYGGDIDAMMALWAEDCTFKTGGNIYSGKDAVRALFASGGGFTHYWVGLTAAFKISATPHGNTADIYFECHYADPSVTPYALRADRSLYGTIKRVNGKWLLWHMNGDAAPL
jgi:ketosteroid isomerase-like protein